MKNQSILSGGLAVEEAMVLQQNTLRGSTAAAPVVATAAADDDDIGLDIVHSGS